MESNYTVHIVGLFDILDMGDDLSEIFGELSLDSASLEDSMRVHQNPHFPVSLAVLSFSILLKRICHGD